MGCARKITAEQQTAMNAEHQNAVENEACGRVMKLTSSDISVKGNPFCNYNHIAFVLHEQDHVITEVQMHPESLNSGGAAHGGPIFSMGDTAAGHAARTDGRRYVTQTANIHFIRNVGLGHTIHAEARIQHRGRATCLVDVKFTDEEEHLLASETYTFFCIE